MKNRDGERQNEKNVWRVQLTKENSVEYFFSLCIQVDWKTLKGFSIGKDISDYVQTKCV